MQEILRNNTRTTLHSSVQQGLGFAPKTNFIGALQDSTSWRRKMLAARFGSDAPAARAFLQRQAQFKIGKMIVQGAAVAAINHALGVDKGLVSLALNARPSAQLKTPNPTEARL